MGGSRLGGVKGVYKRKYKEGGSKDPTNTCISLYPVSPGYSGQVAAEELQIQILKKICLHKANRTFKKKQEQISLKKLSYLILFLMCYFRHNFFSLFLTFFCHLKFIKLHFILN